MTDRQKDILTAGVTLAIGILFIGGVVDPLMGNVDAPPKDDAIQGFINVCITPLLAIAIIFGLFAGVMLFSEWLFNDETER